MLVQLLKLLNTSLPSTYCCRKFFSWEK